MTEYIKQWIEKEIESSKSNNYPPDILIGIRLGLTKGIEIAEGFAEWAAREGVIWNDLVQKWHHKEGASFTTSQLLEKYLQYLSSINKEK